MLIGEYAASVSDKNRLALPTKLRKQLSERLVVTRGYEGCALIMNQSRWQQLIAEIDRNSLFRLTVRDTKRYLLGGASTLQPDAQGRVIVPQYILAHADIDKLVVLIGVGQWIELWSQQAWQTKVDYLTENAADIADKLAAENGN